MRARERATAVLTVIALATSVLAVGSALRWAAALTTILVAVALIPLVTSRRGISLKSPLIIVLLIALGLTAFQLIPFPDWLLDRMDPVGHALRADGARLAGVSVWPSITLDPSGTLRAAAFLVVLLGVAVLGLRFSASEDGRLFCLGTVAGVCGLTAAIVGIHSVFGATSLYGVYEPIQATPPVLGPLLNPNHLGCLMALGAVVAAGLFMHTKQSMAARGAWLMTSLGCIVVVLASLSRGAVLALGTGLFVTLSCTLAQRLARPTDRLARSSRKKFIIYTLPIATVALCVLVVVVFTTAGTSAQQLANTSLQEIQEPKSKYAAWRSSTELLEEAPLVGIGRGALEPAFTRVHPASAFVTFSHLENEYLQAVVEWGVPGAAAIAIGLGWFALIAIRRWRDGPLTAAALGGVTAVAIQSNVDFGIELLGVAIPITFVAATLGARRLRALHDRAATGARTARLGHLVALTAAAIVLCLPITTTVEEDHIALDDRPTLPEIETSIERHPLDYYGYAVAAETMVRDGNTDAIAMLNHALVLHPTHPGLHLFAGRLLLARHPDQAAGEYTASLEGTPDPRDVLVEIAKSFPAEAAAEAIPVDYENTELVSKTLVDKGYPQLALAWIRRVVDAHPRSTTAIETMHDLAKQLNQLDIAERATRLQLELMSTPHARLQLAELLSKRGAHDEAIKLLSDVATWHGRIEDQTAAWLLLCDEHFAVANLDETTRCLRRLDGQGLMLGRRNQLDDRFEAIDKVRKKQGLLEHYRTGNPDNSPIIPRLPP